MQAGIVGMGIMGRLLALTLQNAGWQVTIFDKDSGDTNCSFAAGGLLTPYSELDKAEFAVFKLGQESVQNLWPSIIKQLPDNIYFKNSGSIVINHPQDSREWEHFSKRINSQLDEYTRAYQKVTNKQLCTLEPELSKFAQAYYFPNEAHIDCQSLMNALKSHLTHKSTAWHTNNSVLEIKSRLIITKSKSYKFDMVFDCRGMGACSSFKDLRGLRGELIWLYAPDVKLQRPIRLLHPRYSLYIVPRPGNIYLVGASELESDCCDDISVRSTLELLTAAYFVHAGFADARIIKTSVQVRPTLASGLPQIKYSDGVIAINGLYRHGYLIAPALAQEVMCHLKNNQISEKMG
ncbi:MAG: FAD-dependent oxidoreductase [Legionellaceae bacterium]|nr:FAD-dependent oxidoreductase [Legionellaceae bacterium]